MQSGDFIIATDEGLQVVSGWLVADYFGIHENGAGLFDVTHIPSGMSIGKNLPSSARGSFLAHGAAYVVPNDPVPEVDPGMRDKMIEYRRYLRAEPGNAMCFINWLSLGGV